MVFKVLRSAEGDHDTISIFDHLLESYAALGEPRADAAERAAKRLRAINVDMEALGKNPFQGTLMPEIAPGLRRVTKSRAVFYFHVDDQQQLVLVIAVFFGGQDHLRHIVKRLGGTA
jgi:plasmid stabilization system protein ParE